MTPDRLRDSRPTVAAREQAGEQAGEPVVGPGLPPAVTDPTPFITEDALTVA